MDIEAITKLPFSKADQYKYNLLTSVVANMAETLKISPTKNPFQSQTPKIIEYGRMKIIPFDKFKSLDDQLKKYLWNAYKTEYNRLNKIYDDKKEKIDKSALQKSKITKSNIKI